MIFYSLMSLLDGRAITREDATVLADAITREDGFTVLEDNCTKHNENSIA